MPSQPIHGLVAAPHAPLGDGGELSIGRLEKQIAFLATQGLAGVFVNGTTGEGLSLTSAERRNVLEKWVEMAPAGLKVIAHVGHHAVDEAAALASHAAGLGVHAVSVMGPSFLKPASAKELVAFCQPVSAAAPDTPFYYYHIPSLTGVTVAMRSFLEAAEARIPTLAGLKFTHSDLYDFQRCLGFEDGRYDILWGVDEALLGALAVGATGAVGSTYNYAAPLYRAMIEAFERGDMEAARAGAATAVRLVEVLMRYGVLAGGKAAMGLHGVELGPTRPPVTLLEGDRKADLLREIETLAAIDPA